MFKFSNKFSFLAAFCTLYFLYNFCAVLCFAVEDYFDVYAHPCFLVGDDYWSSLGKMLCSGILALYFRKSQATNSILIAMTQTLHALFVLVIVMHISQLVSNYFEARETRADFWIFLINVIAVLVYISIIYCAEKTEKGKIYTYMITGIFVACFSVAYGLASYYVPRAVVKTLRQDDDVVNSVRQVVEALKSGLEIPSGLAERVQVKDEDGKRVISYEFVTDFEKLKQEGRYVRHLRKKFDRTADVYKQGDKVGAFEFKKGKHEMSVALPKKGR